MAPNGTEPIQGEVVHDAAIVPIQPDTLGPIGVRNPAAMVKEAAEMANALAEIINTQKLYAIIQGKKYVTCEGWTTLGAMLGIVTVEDYVKEVTNGFEARVRLITARDGRIVGGASAICTSDEPTWKTRSPYALRSMALTRATSKAFRLAYAWIMKLAGYEATPAEEMADIAKGDWETGKEAAKAVLDRKVAEAKGSAPAHADKGAAQLEGKAAALKQVHFDTRGEWTYLTGDGLGTLLHFLGLPAEEGGIYQFKEKFMAADKDEQGFPTDWRVKSNKAELLAEAAVSYGLDAKQASVQAGVGQTETRAITSSRSPRDASSGQVAPELGQGRVSRVDGPAPNISPIIQEAKLVTEGVTNPFVAVKWGNAQFSTFDQKLFEYLIDGQGKPAEFQLSKPVKKNGRTYVNLLRVIRIGKTTFSDNVPDLQQSLR